MNKNSRILVVNPSGIIGYALHKKLTNHGYYNLISTHDLDYGNPIAIKNLIFDARPEYVFVSDVEDWVEENFIKYAGIANCKVVVNYQKATDNKKHLEKYKNTTTICIDEIYGDNDDYRYESCSLFPELLRTIHDAKTFNLPITYLNVGENQMIDLMHSDDLASASIHIADACSKGSVAVVKTRSATHIRHLCNLIKEYLEYSGDIVYIESYIDNTTQKYAHNRTETSIHWFAKTPIEQGIARVYSSLLDKNKYFFVTEFFNS